MTMSPVRTGQGAQHATSASRAPRKKSRAGRQMAARWPSYVVLIITAVAFIAPFYYTIVIASRSNAQMNQVPPPLIPGGELWSNFAAAWNTPQANIPKALVNSLMVSTTVTVGTVFFGTLAGFAFAKLRFTGRNALFGFTIGTMMIPPTLGVIPLYILMANLHWTDQLQSVILPTVVTAFGVFFMRQALIEALPDELVEAGRVDGASAFRIFWSIVLPIARPAMAVLAMLTFMTSWNDFFWPIIALTSNNPTVQVALNNLGGGYVPDHSIIMAGTLLCTLPLIVVFLFLGRQIVGGIMQGAVKG